MLAWVGPLLFTLLGGAVRFWELGRPRALVFDETYYVKEGWSLIRFGTEMALAGTPARDTVDAQWADGVTDVHDPLVGSMVVHPPVGKWIIGAGQWLVGPDDPVGWRLGVAVLGTVSILILGRVAWRLFGSVTGAWLASFLMAFEGLHLTMSRTAILDIIVLFFALVGFACLLIDRDLTRARWARMLADRDPGTPPLRFGPAGGLRPWRWAAGLALALATSTKWSGLFFVAAFGLLTLGWDIAGRRRLGIGRPVTTALGRDGPYAALQLVAVTAVVYPLTWLGWFRSEHGYLRGWGAQHPGEGVTWLPDALRSFVHYHQQMWHFNTTLTTPHGYQSKAWSWLVQWRPTSFYYQQVSGGGGCDSDPCVQAVTSIGTVTLWWASIPALLFVLWSAVRHLDGRAAAIITGVLAGYAPWFYWHDRTVFSFYAVAFEPWIVLAVVFLLLRVLEPAFADASDSGRHGVRIGVVTAYLTISLAVFAFFVPVQTAMVISHQTWLLRMWLPSWV